MYIWVPKVHPGAPYLHPCPSSTPFHYPPWATLCLYSYLLYIWVPMVHPDVPCLYPCPSPTPCHYLPCATLCLYLYLSLLTFYCVPPCPLSASPLPLSLFGPSCGCCCIA